MNEKVRLETTQSTMRMRRRRRVVAGEPYGDFDDELERIAESIAAVDAEIAPLARAAAELGNPTWGPLMRAGVDKSLFARQVEKYADVYTSRVSNFEVATPYGYLRAARGSLPPRSGHRRRLTTRRSGTEGGGKELTPSMPRWLPLGLCVVVLAAGCGDDGSPAVAEFESAPAEPIDFPPAPAVPAGPLDPALAADLDAVFAGLEEPVDLAALGRVGASGDARVAWLLADLLRFVNTGDLFEAARRGWEELTGVAIEPVQSHWNFAIDHLIAWDLPAPPDYPRWKRQLYELVEPRWAPFFDDAEATIDWRWIGWGGVRIDDRPLDAVDRPCPLGCIPALNDPLLTAADDGDWYSDDAVVFGVELGGEAVAFPKNIMEVHEMVNMTIGGRRIGMPYCTLCGSAQAYLTEPVTAKVDLGGHRSYELRTSGLLSRSNKVMFDLHTMSVFDTFTGEAVSGPLRRAGVTLEQVTVRASTWGEWKQAHPTTLIVAEDGGIGRSYDADPLRGRDDNGPIFPIGDLDPRLGVQEPVVGVELPDGTTVAFPVAEAGAALAEGTEVELAGVRLTTDGAGFGAVDDSGDAVVAHEAFWFAWSQFHPDTLLWSAGR